MPNELGQNWLLLRGLTREAAHWGEFVPMMRSAFPDAQIATLDLPGTGNRYQQKSPDNIAEIAADLRAQALSAGLLERPVTILALSLGAMAAWEWLLQHPEDINAAILINASFGGLSPFYRRMRWQCYQQFINLARQRDVYQRELSVLRLVCNRRDDEETVAREWQAIQQARPVSPRNSLRQVIAAATYRPAATAPQRPVLLLNSCKDRLVDASCTEAIAKKWNLPLRTHPWAGHDLPLDDPDWMVEQIKQWLAEA